jgi:hypothetical protein
LALVKYFDLVKFEEIFNFAYHEPRRKPKLGHYSMMIGILMLLFIGFNHIWHFTYVRLDAMHCEIIRLTQLPVASTFWRYVDSLGINQAKSLMKPVNILPGSCGNEKLKRQEAAAFLKNNQCSNTWMRSRGFISW